MAANKVMRSIEAPGGERCVDLYRRLDGVWGWAEYRRDPEDPRGWAGIGIGGEGFDSLDGALAGARAMVGWLSAT